MREKIKAWYVKYLNRQAREDEILLWINNIKSGRMTLLQAESSVIGSDEFFVLHGSTIEGFISGMFSTYTVSPEEIYAWMQKAVHNRVETAVEFLAQTKGVS